MNDSSYPDESNLLDRNVSDDVDPTISAEALTWPNYVQLWINVTTGALGCCANGVVLSLLLAAKKLRVHPSYFLIKFQILLDFMACVLLTISYSFELVRNGNAEVMRRWGNAICILFVSNGLVYIMLYAATTNLVIIALERYIKVVHPIKHRNIFCRYAHFQINCKIHMKVQLWFALLISIFYRTLQCLSYNVYWRTNASSYYYCNHAAHAFILRKISDWLNIILILYSWWWLPAIDLHHKKNIFLVILFLAGHGKLQVPRMIFHVLRVVYSFGCYLFYIR